MSRYVPLAAVLGGMLALSTSAAAGPKPGGCKHHENEACRNYEVEQAFTAFVRKHMPPVGSPELAGSAELCKTIRHRAHRYRCVFEPEEPGVPHTCIVKGTAIQVKPRVYRFRSIKVAPSCPKWEASK